MFSSSAEHVAPRFAWPSWKALVAVVGLNLFLLASVLVLQSKAVLVLAGLAFVVFTVVTLRWPELGTTAVVFTIYSNVVVAVFRAQMTSGAPMDSESRSALMAVVGLALVVPVFHYLWLRGEPIIFDRPFALICLFAISLLLSTVFSRDPQLATGKFIRFLCEGLVLYFLVVNVVRDEKMLRKSMWAILLAAAFMAALSVYQQATGTLDNLYWGLAQRGGVFAIGASGQEVLLRTRAAGSIGEQNRYAQILLVTLPFAVFFFRHAKHRLIRWASLGSAVLVLAGIVLTFSRGAFIATAILAVLMAMLRLIKWWHLALAVLVVSSYIAIHEPDYLTRMQSLAQVHTLFGSSHTRPTADFSAQERLIGNIASIHVFTKHPIIGVGRGVYAKYFATPEVFRLGLRQVKNYPSHNLYLNIAAESGLLGFILFFSVVGVIAVRLYRQYKVNLIGNPETRDLAACFLLGIFAYLLTGMFLHLAYERYFWLQMALCSAAARVVAQTLQLQVSLTGPDARALAVIPGKAVLPWPPRNA